MLLDATILLLLYVADCCSLLCLSTRDFHFDFELGKAMHFCKAGALLFEYDDVRFSYRTL
jgi:hypothetical protein